MESNIIYSNRFKKLLNSIDLPLSRVLLEIENKDYPISSNYFDITDSNDVISFISDRKAKEILDNNKGKFRYSIIGRFLDPSEKFNYIWEPLGIERKEIKEPPVTTIGTIGKQFISPRSNKTFVVFIPDDARYNKIPINIEALTALFTSPNDPIFYKVGRQSIRVGRGIRAILTAAGVNVTDKEIEEFVNKYKSSIDAMNDSFSNFEIVSGDDISYWYDLEQYYLGEHGQLGTSCMCSVDPNYFDIYTQNPEKVSLVIYKAPEDPTKIRGRALLWSMDDGRKFMDRIYTHYDHDIELFRKYGKKCGYWVKYNNCSASDGDAYNPAPEQRSTEVLELIIGLEKVKYDYYPYLDTLKYFNPDTAVISNSRSPGTILLEDTEGGYSRCSNCDSEGTVSCDDCDGDGTVTCDECDGDGNISCSNCDDGECECDECEGSGEIDDEECIKCSGSGDIKCDECNGSGDITCSSCTGRGTESCSTCTGSGQVNCDDCS